MPCVVFFGSSKMLQVHVENFMVSDVFLLTSKLVSHAHNSLKQFSDAHVSILKSQNIVDAI